LEYPLDIWNFNDLGVISWCRRERKGEGKRFPGVFGNASYSLVVSRILA